MDLRGCPQISASEVRAVFPAVFREVVDGHISNTTPALTGQLHSHRARSNKSHTPRSAARLLASLRAAGPALASWEGNDTLPDNQEELGTDR